MRPEAQRRGCTVRYAELGYEVPQIIRKLREKARPYAEENRLKDHAAEIARLRSLRADLAKAESEHATLEKDETEKGKGRRAALTRTIETAIKEITRLRAVVNMQASWQFGWQGPEPVPGRAGV